MPKTEKELAAGDVSLKEAIAKQSPPVKKVVSEKKKITSIDQLRKLGAKMAGQDEDPEQEEAANADWTDTDSPLGAKPKKKLV